MLSQVISGEVAALRRFLQRLGQGTASRRGRVRARNDLVVLADTTEKGQGGAGVVQDMFDRHTEQW